jgi:hypothetical protein
VRGYNVDGRNFIPDWLRRGYCSMSWREIPEIPAGSAKRDVQRAVAEAMPESSAQLGAQVAYQLHAFLTLMQPGDLVVTVTPDEVHVGTLQGPAAFDASDGPNNARRRPVRWATAERPHVLASPFRGSVTPGPPRGAFVIGVNLRLGWAIPAGMTRGPVRPRTGRAPLLAAPQRRRHLFR